MKQRIVYLSFIVALGTIACQNLKQLPADNKESQSSISYETSVQPIVQDFCVSCHSGIRPSARFRLTTYEEVRLQAEKGELLNRINNARDPMPRGGLMPKKYRATIERWAKEGYLESSTATAETAAAEADFIPPPISPIDLNVEGFEFFELMQGHWIGKMNIMGQKFEWFSFDYRPISPAHIHGIFEGGSMGNLLTSFFIANYKGTKTLMARNGGVLNDTYRISYFVLDKVELSANRQYFRLIDAYGGQDIMWMELEFTNDQLNFNSYTSRFGLNGKPKLHMKFQARRKHLEIAKKAVEHLNYPKNAIEKDFSRGLPTPVWGEEYPTITSATYLYRDREKDLSTLGKLAGDPFGIDELPHLSTLEVKMERNEEIRDQKLIIYLSKEALTDENGSFIMEYGYIKEELFNGIFLFPEIAPKQDDFTFHYLHPGDYYITVVADVNEDGYASKGDISSVSKSFSIAAKEKQSLEIKGILSKN